MNTFALENIRIIIGLGNIGKKYEYSRHNAGFLFVQSIVSGQWKEDRKLQSFIAEKLVRGTKMRFSCPTTMMNESGRAVQKIISYYDIRPDEILVVYDDLDIALGEYKVQFGKAPRVHNGVNSVVQHLSTMQFWHARIGIDSRSYEQRKNQPGRDYVLERFSRTELETLYNTFDKIKNTYFVSDQEIASLNTAKVS